MTPSSTAAPSRPSRVSWSELLGLGGGRITAAGSVGTIHVLVNPIYNMTLGLNPAWISVAVFIQRMWDAMLDPICGQYSDNFRSRWGRRRPLMLISLPVLVILFGLMWWFPRGASHAYLFGHFLLCSLAFHAAHSIYSMAHGGLGLEATNDYHERTRIAGITLAFGFVFLIGSQWFFPLTQLPIFSDTLEGLRWITVICCVAFFLIGLLPILLCKERQYAHVAAHQPRVSLMANLRAVRDTKPLVVLVTARFVATFSYNIVGVMFLYMNNYYVFGGDIRRAAITIGIIASAFQISATVSSLFIYPRLTRWLGKRRVFQLAASILMVGSVAKLFVYQPGQPWLQLVVLITNGASSAGMMMMATSMLGDIADYDEWRNGVRREALFTSIWNWFENAGNSLGSLITGFLLVAIGFDAMLGAQSPHTLELMKFSYFLAPFTGGLIALLIIQRYDLDEKKVQAIKVELEKARAT